MNKKLRKHLQERQDAEILIANEYCIAERRITTHIISYDHDVESAYHPSDREKRCKECDLRTTTTEFPWTYRDLETMKDQS